MSDLYEWQSKAEEYMKVGSRVTCNPPPTDTDEDWIVLDLDKSIEKHLDKNGWEYGGSLNCDDRFASFKKGVVNVICCFTDKEYTSFVLATNVSRQLNVMDKSDRIVLFEAIMYGNDATPEYWGVS